MEQEKKGKTRNFQVSLTEVTPKYGAQICTEEEVWETLKFIDQKIMGIKNINGIDSYVNSIMPILTIIFTSLYFIFAQGKNFKLPKDEDFIGTIVLILAGIATALLFIMLGSLEKMREIRKLKKIGQIILSSYKAGECTRTTLFQQREKALEIASEVASKNFRERIKSYFSTNDSTTIFLT